MNTFCVINKYGTHCNCWILGEGECCDCGEPQDKLKDKITDSETGDEREP